MNIVILAGGTGSIALQKGLYDLYESKTDGIDTKIIVNAYDNGLSTGSVRQVLGGKILGPSDVRKNQTTRLQLENPTSPWLDFLNIRFTAESSKAQAYCLARIDEFETKNKQSTREIVDAVNEYFTASLASKIDYSDFSLANIIYAGLAKANGYSLRAAAKIMARLLGIKDNVLLNDDTSLFLGAISKSDVRVTDEGDIVSWGKVDDPFVDLFFTDAFGNASKPVLCAEAHDAIVEADLLILSSGTQWSSLIPTYASSMFKSAIEQCQGKILMVMNKHPDKDSPGQTASEIIDILVPTYFPENTLNVILDSTGHDQMKQLDVNAKSLIQSHEAFDLGGSLSFPLDYKKHHPMKLAQAVGEMFFDQYLQSDHFVFDYDDTLVGRGNVFPISSKTNITTLGSLNFTKNVAICTGNSIKAIKLKASAFAGIDPHTFETVFKPLTVFADGGVNKYSYDTETVYNEDDGVSHTLVECINPNLLIKPLGPFGIRSILKVLQAAGIPANKIENRGNAMISIKPIDPEYREMVLKLIRFALGTASEALNIRAAGRTTIEIVTKGLSKVETISHIMKTSNPKQITYVGDELHDGNDACINGIDNVKCLSVKNPAKTAFFLLTLSNLH